MIYTVTSKRNWCATKTFETLDEAISWCNRQKTKHGHLVQHFDTWTAEDGTKTSGTKRDYETYGNKGREDNA